MHSLFWGELTIVQDCFGFSFLIGKKDPGLYNGCWAWSHCECLDWNDWRGNCEITQAIARSLSARDVTQGCVYTGLVGEERLFLSSSVLEPYMSRKLLEKIPGSKTMNRSDRFQTKSHASGTGHLFYRCLHSLPLNWRWKLGQDSEGVAGNGNLKRTMHVKANPNIPFPLSFSPEWASALCEVYTVGTWPKSECCQTKPALSTDHKHCFPSTCPTSFPFPSLCTSVYSWVNWEPEKEWDLNQDTKEVRGLSSG